MNYGSGWKKGIVLVIICIAIGASMATVEGCAAHRTAVAGTPSAPITPQEQLNYDNAQFAIHNKSIAEAIVATQQQGFISTEYFDKLTTGQVQITKIHEQLTPLLAAASPTNSAQIQSLVTQIKTTATQMIADGSVGIKNDTSKSSITDEVNALVTLGNSIISTLTTMGVIKN